MEKFSSNALENLARAGYFDAEPSADVGLSVAQKTALDAVRAAPGSTTIEIARKVQRPTTTVKHTLGRLQDMSLVRADGTPVRWYPVSFVPIGGDAEPNGS